MVVTVEELPIAAPSARKTSHLQRNEHGSVLQKVFEFSCDLNLLPWMVNSANQKKKSKVDYLLIRRRMESRLPTHLFPLFFLFSNGKY
jgi:hypothetical protein